MRVGLPWAGRGGLEWLCPACQPKPCQMEGGLDWAALLRPSKGICLKRNPLERLPDSPCLAAPSFCLFLWQGSHCLPLRTGPHLRGCLCRGFNETEELEELLLGSPARWPKGFRFSMRLLLGSTDGRDDGRLLALLRQSLGCSGEGIIPAPQHELKGATPVVPPPP